jgi:ACS family tartrate transporter-like MFS transporter
MITLTLGAIAVYAALPAFWTLPAAMLRGRAAAGGIALINSVGNLGGFLGPSLMGFSKRVSGTHAAGLWMLGLLLVTSGLLVLMMGGRHRY